jgi:hypothetical protein
MIDNVYWLTPVPTPVVASSHVTMRIRAGRVVNEGNYTTQTTPVPTPVVASSYATRRILTGRVYMRATTPKLSLK